MALSSQTSQIRLNNFIGGMTMKGILNKSLIFAFLGVYLQRFLYSVPLDPIKVPNIGNAYNYFTDKTSAP